MYHSITFGDKNTWEDWRLIPTSRPVINPPAVNSMFIDVTGGNGSIDLTESISGAPTFKDRTGSFEFYVDNDFKPWQNMFSELLMYFHGTEVDVRGKDDENNDERSYKQIIIDSIGGEWQSTLDYLNATLVNMIGGYLITRRQNDINYVDWVKDYVSESTQPISFGENLIDLEEDATPDDLFTVLIPLGDEGLTIKDVNNGSVELVDTEAVSEYGRIVETKQFNSVSNASTLLENGKRYLAEHSKLKPVFTITAIDLNLVNKDIKAIRVGSSVSIQSKPHTLSDKMTCTKIEYDINRPENNTYTFGDQKQTLTERHSQNAKQTEENSKKTGGGGVGDATEEAVNKKLTEFHDAYLSIPTDADGNPIGTAELAAVCQHLIDKVGIVQKWVGLTINSEEGTATLQSQWKKDIAVQAEHLGNLLGDMTEKGTITDADDAYFETVAGENLAAARQFAKYAKWVVDQNTGKVEIKQAIAGITTTCTNLKSSIDIATSSFNGKLARIQLESDDLESRINLLADKINLRGNVTIQGQLDLTETKIVGLRDALADLKNGKVTATRLETSSLKANTISVVGTVSAEVGRFDTLYLGGKVGFWKSLTIVKSFTQASGETASGAAVTQQTILVSGSVQTATHVPSEGQTITF